MRADAQADRESEAAALATGRFGIPRKIAKNTIETDLTLHSELSRDIRHDFLARISDPDKGRSTT